MIDTHIRFRRILVVCTRQIGDVLLATPLIRAARRRWPDARIDVLGLTGTTGMLSGNTDVSGVIEMGGRIGWPGRWQLLRRLWRRYDLALLTQNSDREYILGWFAARVRAGLAPGDARKDEWKRRVLHHAVPNSAESLHIAVEKLRLLEPWVEMPHAIEVIPPPGADLPPDLASRLRSSPIVIHVPSMWRYKQWPISSYRRLIVALLDRGHQVVLTGSPSATDRQLIAECIDGLESREDLIDAAGRLELNQVTSLLRRAGLYIGPDTSITHLAAACRTPLVSLFGPTNPMVWGPWPQDSTGPTPFVMQAETQRAGSVILLQGGLACVPCRMEGCDRHRASRSDCLETMSVDRVLNAALGLLAERSGRAELSLEPGP